MDKCICGEINARHCPIHNDTPKTGVPEASTPPREWRLNKEQVQVGERHFESFQVANGEWVVDVSEGIRVIEKSAYDVVHRHNCMLQAKVREFEAERVAELPLIGDQIEQIAALKEKLAAAEAENARLNILDKTDHRYQPCVDKIEALEKQVTGLREEYNELLHDNDVCLEQNAELLGWCERFVAMIDPENQPPQWDIIKFLAEFRAWQKTLRSSINETVISDTYTSVQNFPPKKD